jgi:DNA-binding helix-hairpin-helix protein with protein kinase domain
VLTLQRDELGDLGHRLGEGGQAWVHEAPALTLPDAPGPLVFKHYKQGHAPPNGLHKLVSLRHRIDPAVRARLDGLTAWPLRLVEEHGAVCGVVLPRIPDSFFQSRVLPGTGTHEVGPREVQNLFVSQALARRIGMPDVSLAHRLLICRDFASALHLLHRNDLVVGDLNARNALFRLDALPSVMFVDCDALRFKGSMAVVQQLNAPDWDPPEGAVLSQSTDRYKFGLFVLRCLGNGEQASTTRDPARARAVLDAEGRALLDAALTTDPAARPSVQSWGHYLHWRVTGQRVAPAWTGTAAVAARPPAATRIRRDPVTGRWEPAP